MSKTNLASQLERLKTPQTSLFITKKTRESFIYDSKQASTIDLDTHFSIALSGLSELSAIEPSCNDFFQTLFKDTSKSLDRSILSVEQNEDLNKEIEKFLYKVVSPYFLMTATHKMIEWLIYKYHINKFNTKALIFAILPYHETRYFTRLIQITDLKSEFYWLKHLNKTGTILVKSVLFDFLYKNPESLREFSDKIIQNIKENYDCNLWISFLTSSIISILEKNGIADNFLIFTIQFINSCLKLSNNSLTISAYIILSYLCTKVQLKKSKLEKIQNRMMKNFKKFVASRPNNEFIYCLSTICNNQDIDCLSDDLVGLIVEENLFLNCDIKSPKLLSLIINNLVPKLDKKENSQIILKFLSSIEPNYFVINSLLQTIVNKCEENEETHKNCIEIVKIIERRYPNQFDKSVENIDEKDIEKILHSNLYLKLEEGNFKLVNAINHSNKKIRIAALKSLKDLDNYENLNLNSIEIISDSIKNILYDKERKLLLKVFDIPYLEKFLKKEDLIILSTQIFAKCDLKIKKEDSQSESWLRIRKELFNLVMKMSLNEEEFLNIFSRYLFINNKYGLDFFNEVLNLGKSFKFIQYLNENLKPKKENINNILKNVFQVTSNYVIENNSDIIDILGNENIDMNYSKICHLSVLTFFLNSCSSFEMLNNCANKLITSLNSLIQKHTLVGSNCQMKSSIDYIRIQLESIDDNQILIEFVNYVLEQLLDTVEKSSSFSNSNNFIENTNFYIDNLFNLLCNLIKGKNGKKFKVHYYKFIESCDKAFSNQYFVSMWINQDNLILQEQSLAISCETLKNYRLSEIESLNLLVALSSPEEKIRKLALNLLLTVDLNSNDLINLAAKNSNEYQVSDTAISKIFLNCDNKKRKKFLNLVADHLNNYTVSLNLTIGLLKLLNTNFSTSVINSLNILCADLLNKDELNLKEKEILELTYSLFMNQFIDEKSLQQSNYKLSIQNFCKIMESNFIKDYVYSKLKKKWILSLKSNTLIISVINTLLNEFILTHNEKAKQKLINLLNDGKIVSFLINKYLSSNVYSKEFNKENNQLESQSHKKQIVEKKISFDLDNTNWKKVLILLEIMQSKNEIINSSALLKSLFVLVKDNLLTEEKPSLEYLKQLILYNIHNCLVQQDCELKYFEIELLFSLMSRLRLKASQKEILSILNLVTPYFKKEVLNNFILIFTYIGTNMVNCSGQFEMKLIDETLETIIPCLLEENEKLKNQITDSFIDALADIPPHRLVHVFSKLIKLYNTENSLWFVLFKLDIRTIRENLFEEKDFFIFNESLISLFNEDIHLNTMVNIVVTSIKILDSKFIFGSDTITVKESAQLNILLMKQLNIILNSEKFLSLVSNVDWEVVNLHFKNLLEQLILLLIKLEKNEFSEDQNQMLMMTYKTIENVHNLLPLEEFSDVLQHLLNNGLKVTYKKTLKVFISKLSSTNNFDINNLTWKNFFKSLNSIIENRELDQNEESYVIVQYAFVALKIISKKLENNENLHDEMIQSINITIESIKDLDLQDPKAFNLFVSGIICLSKLLCVLKTKAIPYISTSVQLLIKTFSHNSDLVNISCFTALAKITKIFPTYIGTFLPEILIKICSLTSRREKNEDLNNKMMVVEKNLISLIPFRKVIEVLNITYNSMKEQNLDSLVYFFDFTKRCFSPLTNSSINANISSINKFLFNIVCFRSELYEKLSMEQMEKVERCSLAVVCTFLPKLKETKFKVFISRLYEWAETGCKNYYYKLQTFFNLTNQLADSVKSIFPIFVTPVIAPTCIKILSKETIENTEIEVHQKHDLVLNVLKSVFKSIHYNVKSVLTSKEVEIFMNLIIEQIDYDFGSEKMYQERIVDGISKCVEGLVKGFNDYQMIKSLQKNILEKTKHKNNVKKYNALFVLHKFILSNTEEYVSYLPDAVPYLVELYEDDNENIQKLLVETFRDIEQIIGEPISNYL